MDVQLPMSLHTEPLPGATNRVAVLYGPLVLAGELGTNGMLAPYAKDQAAFLTLPTPPVPAFISEGDSLIEHVAPTAEPLVFRTKSPGQPGEVTLAPLYSIHDERYAVYWEVYNHAGWESHRAEREAEAQRQADLDAHTVDILHPGEMQPERDHNVQGDKSGPGEFSGRHLRHAWDGGWFSFDMKVSPTDANELRCTWWGGEEGARAFDILVDGTLIKTVSLHIDQPGKFWDANYPIPAELTRGKAKVTIKLQAHPANFAGGLFGCRVVRLGP